MTGKTILLLCVAGLSAVAQPFGVGFKGGVPLTDLFDSSNSFQTSTDRYIIGVMAELRLPFGLAIEGDALYTRANLSGPSGVPQFLFSNDTNSWEFPVVLKKKFGGASVGVAAVRPYVEAGGSFRTLSGLSNLPSLITSGQKVNDSDSGFVLGGGVEFRALFLKISPGVRWTRWGASELTTSDVFRFKQNQGQFLVGISF